MFEKDKEIKEFLQKKENRLASKSYSGKREEIASGENSV